ncbi:LPS assembly lipoprotein LptE [Paludibacterium purpuratum]|uniref:LPS-assembly lipoprotein LptE n=1 Tax=Paludibacterium purpuratum TaxID=1144873 RepID=A0A4R7B746_9NEIS|nr:LPS assembly lipoprotein LptE [Paludibacterium purpuratum]TDR80521.1 LPS-assembly lipoprotein [Paludibacterium purpuratum]
MTRLFTLLSALAFAVVLAACGFHLRGLGDSTQRTFPFTRLYIDSTLPVAQQVTTALKSYPNVTVVDSVKGADGVLRIIDEKRDKDLSAIDRSGKANEYRLNYRVTAQLWINGMQAGRDIVLNQSRTMTYNDAAVLGKDQEEALLWSDMARNVAQLMIYRLSNNQMLRDAASAAAGVAPPDAKTNNAVSQP